MGLTFNGITYTNEGICSLASDKLLNNNLLPYEESFFSFLLEWYNSSDFVLLKTSGSTGKPKEIEVLKKNIEESAKRTLSFFDLQPGMNVLLCMSTDFVAGKLMVVRAITGSLNLVLANPSGFPLKGLDNLAIDFAAMVPLQVYNCIRDSKLILILQRIKTLIIGGGVVDTTIKEKLAVFPNKVYLTYGMTETLTHVAVQPLSGEELEDRFYVLPGFSVDVDERSCLLIDTGYNGISEIKTNDVVDLIGENKFVWKGRYDNVVNSGGLKFFPELIEKKIGDTLLGRRYFIAGQPDAKFGEILVLVIEGSSLSNKELHAIEGCFKRTLTKLETPKKIMVASKLLETPTHKIQRSKTLKSIA